MLELHIGRTHPEVRGQGKSINASHIGPPPGHCLPAAPHPRVGGWTEEAGGRSEMKKQDSRKYTQNHSGVWFNSEDIRKPLGSFK